MQGMKIRRACEPLLKEHLRAFPCVSLIGPRQCGKTTLLETLPKGWQVLDLERSSDYDAIARDPGLFLRLNPGRIAIDEAQMLPALFPALRVAIDSNRSARGRFVITGSSSPDLLRSVSESLAGRIGVIEMAPLSWSEVRPSAGPSPLAALAKGPAKAEDLLAAARPCGDIKAAHAFWFRGGYPEPWVRKGDRFRKLWMDQYVRTYLYRDVGRLFPGLNQAKFQLFLQLLAGLSGTLVNCAELARAIGVSQPTVRDYFEIAHGTFLWRRIPPYVRNALKRLVKHPKGHLRDTGLLHHLLRTPDMNAALAHPGMGRFWEGFVSEEIIRRLNCEGASFDYYYYRTSAGAEVDLVLEGDFGLVPIEIKHSQSLGAGELRPLRDFIKGYGCRLGIVINNDEKPRLYEKNIVGLPFTCL